MMCCPALSDTVEYVAIPLLLIAPAPMVVGPSRNVTVPPGTMVVPPEPATVAVNTTDVAKTDGLGLAPSDVVVGCLTTSISTEEVADAFWSSPLYTAVTWCAPVARVVVEKAATPVPLRTAVPTLTVPSLNLTEPVGAEVPDVATLAVNVTAVLRVAGFGLAVSLITVGSTARASTRDRKSVV